MNNKKDNNHFGVVLAIVGLAVVVFMLCGGLGVAIVLPAIQMAREAATRELARNNLEQIELALRNYHANLTEAELNEEEEPATDATDENAVAPVPISNAEIEVLANRFRAEWMVAQADTTFEAATVFETRKTDEGWRVTFESITRPADTAESVQRHYLHVFIDQDGGLAKIERGAEQRK